MATSRLATPVVLLIFNRPDTTTKVFAEVAMAKPRQLFVVADGPRPDHPDDAKLCEATRAIIDQVDWDCEVSLNYADHNLGLRRRVASGLNWTFDQVEQAIILEDDCVPHPDFFDFCTGMLEWYRNDERVMMISGMNYLADKYVAGQGYFFCRYFAIWGWATWRRAWRKYDDEMVGWGDLKANNILHGLCSDQNQARYLTEMFDSVATGNTNSWAIRWFYSCMMSYGLAATPAVNLVTNIGVSGTHTRQQPSRNHFLPTTPLPTDEITKRTWMYPDMEYERLLYETILRRPYYHRLLKRLGILDLAISLRNRLR